MDSRKSKPYKGNRKSSGQNSNRRYNKTETEEAKYKGTKPNDPKWYMGDGRLANNVGHISFGAPIGRPLNITSHASGYPSGAVSIPGTMSILYTPGPGVATHPNSPINIAANDLYASLRTEISGTRSYEAPDLMMYIMAVDSALSYLSWMTRLYGTMRTFSQSNWYVGKACVIGMGGRYSDLMQNLALLRSYINIYTTKLAAFAIPDLPLIRRHWFMNSGIYKDHDIDKAQLYFFTPAYLYMWDEGVGNGTRLIPKGIGVTNTLDSSGKMTEQLHSYATIVQTGNAIVDALYKSEDVATISGDILKYFKTRGLMNLALLSEDYAVLPEYSEEMCLEIHNMTPVGSQPVSLSSSGFVPDINALIVEQLPGINQGYLYYNPQFSNSCLTAFEPVIDCFANDPTVEDVMVATRLKAWGTPATNAGTVGWQIEAFGSELVHFARIGYYVSGSADPAYARLWDDGHSSTDALHMYLEKFRGRPLLPNVSSSSTALAGLCGDVHNFATVNLRELQDIHIVAMCNLLGIPYFGVANA